MVKMAGYSEEYNINSFLPILPQRKKRKVPVGPLKKRNVGKTAVKNGEIC